MSTPSNKDRSELQSNIERIARCYKARVDNPTREAFNTPATNASGDLRARVYRLVRRVRRRDTHVLGFDPFFSVLLLVFSELGLTAKKDRNRARLMAKELRYADERNVPRKYLIGFIHQVGGRKGIERRHADGLSRIVIEHHPRQGRALVAKYPKTREAMRRRRHRAGGSSSRRRSREALLHRE